LHVAVVTTRFCFLIGIQYYCSVRFALAHNIYLLLETLPFVTSDELGFDHLRELCRQTIEVSEQLSFILSAGQLSDLTIPVPMSCPGHIHQVERLLFAVAFHPWSSCHLLICKTTKRTSNLLWLKLLARRKSKYCVDRPSVLNVDVNWSDSRNLPPSA